MTKHVSTGILSLSLVALLLGPMPVFAQFHDDFDGTVVDTTAWVLEPGDGQIVVAGGVVTLSCAGSSFPVVTSRYDIFPPGDFRVRVGMQYVSQNRCGDGFGAMDNFWEDYFSGNACRPFLIWQDGGGLYVYSGSSGYTLLGSGDTGYHIYEWSYAGAQYEFSMDGTVRAIGACAPRATHVFFGHPHPIGCTPWTSFAIDFIDVSSFGETAARRTSWGRLKQIYR